MDMSDRELLGLSEKEVWCRNWREYFEAGCECMGWLRQQDNVSDAAAVLHYVKNCNCSRNLEQPDQLAIVEAAAEIGRNMDE